MALIHINKLFGRLKDFFRRRIFFRSSIYGQVILTITILAILLFFSVGVIFRSVNERYLNTVIKQNGHNIGSIVKGALYYSMLANDRSALQNTLQNINNLPGIEDVNIYDSEDNLVYSAYLRDSLNHDNPNCKGCHPDIGTMFSRTKEDFRIVSMNSDCQMSRKNYDYRLLLIKNPILNEPSCYTASCHAHSQTKKVLGSFVIKIPLEELDSAVHTTSTDFFILAALATVLLFVFLLFFTKKQIHSPLKAILKASEAVTNGDRSKRLEIKSNQLADMRMVSNAFNEMLDSLEQATKELHNWSQQLEYKVQKKTEELSQIQKELIHVERIASLGRLSSSVAHEINNPLSGVLTYTKLVRKQLQKLEMAEQTKQPMIKYLKVIEDETKRCGEIVKGLLEFSRKDQQDLKMEHLHKILGEVETLMAHRMKMSGINFQTEFNATHDLINCSENQIKQACLAILLNASEAVDENGEILLRTVNIKDDKIKISVIDNGVGISEEDLSHIFEPFFSAKQKSSGIGLGLAIVHGIVQSHNGKVEVSSTLGKGTTMSIILPVIKDKKEN